MKNDIKISVILPIYNVKSYLKRSIDSILYQNFGNLEMILVDDGSTDGSSVILDEYEKKFENIKVIYQQNAGSGAARNAGLKASVGEYIYFMDPDDWLEGEMFAENYDLLSKYSPDVLIFGWYDHINDIIKSVNFKDKYICNKKEFISEFSDMFKKNLLYTVWNKLYKRKFLIENNLSFGNERNGQDYLFNIKLYDKINKVVLNHTKYYHYVMKREDAATTKFHPEIFNLYKKEQTELIKFMTRNNIDGGNIISDRWWFILVNTWRRSIKQKNKDTNKYMKIILNEYIANNYININDLSRIKTKLGYIFFFRTGIYKYY